MTSPTVPRVRRTGQNTQFTYNLPQRVSDVQTYPVQSPQGATIFVYGHENGVTIVWRGGRRFKPQQERHGQDKHQNGTSEDAIMLIDSDDDEQTQSNEASAAHLFQDKPQFEDEHDEGPYPEIVQTLDLTLGTAVLHVAVMPVTPSILQDTSSAAASFLSERMVLAVSCVTSDVYMITVPLTPPSPKSKAREELRSSLLAGQAGSGAWGETLVLLGGQRRRSDRLAITLVSPKSSEPKRKLPRAVVAACSRQASGTLMLWDVALDLQPKTDRPIEPFQTEFLPHPLNSISFNPIHTTQLLAVSPHHAVRIYDYAVSALPPDSEAAGPFPTQGSWLLSLYQPYARPTASRKPVLDAAWISHGRAIFALMADGMWGVWDVDRVSPSASSSAAIATKLKSGVKGAALTSFCISGYVEGTGSLRSVAAQQQKENHTGEFAPMTPHTRRQATASLGCANTLECLTAVQGGLRVITLPARGKALQDESVVLWVGGLEHVCVIPAMSKFWESQLRRGAGGGVNLFSGAQPTRMIKLADLSTGLLGERLCGVDLLLATGNPGSAGEEHGGLPVDVLVQGESRLVIVRYGEGDSGKNVGSFMPGRTRRLFPRGEGSSAIVVHGKSDRATSLSFNLSTAKPGTLRHKSCHDSQDGAASGRQADSSDSRPRVGFEFMDTMNAAADVSADLTARDVEAEMLDIMDIDKALESMEDSRGSGRKKVYFEQD
ncbi:uncharacterized protein UV8b_05128 [Ustilaginoidea virens]|uniref:Nucleoporin NUP37 n=1 Tax=Ustilaginoidea virens TaxID=1159556 RepID=A0A8E5MIS3_USTVR|nr:uncharacterized protein UV8b_05128 [Ustilaginoidea virens]QUC20887.1 hypothetical protein UV8b_05128 [Ustilaginoidea virens]